MRIQRIGPSLLFAIFLFLAIPESAEATGILDEASFSVVVAEQGRDSGKPAGDFVSTKAGQEPIEHQFERIDTKRTQGPEP